MIKAIATDLDGTLFYPKRKLRLLKRKNKKFLKRMSALGVEIVLVTGRNKAISEKIEKKLKLSRKLSMVGCSGALLVHEGQIVEDAPMSKQEILRLLDEFDRHPEIKTCVFMGNFKGMMIDPTHFPKILCPLALLGLKSQGVYYEHSRFGRKRIMKMLEDSSSKVYKVMPIFGLSDRGKKGTALAKKWRERVAPQFKDDFEFFESGTAVEIVKKGNDKASALKKLFAMDGILDDEVMVIGDSGNDIPMLQKFPNSFAMNNAPEYVKRQASHSIQYVYELEQYIKTTK